MDPVVRQLLEAQFSHVRSRVASLETLTRETEEDDGFETEAFSVPAASSHRTISSGGGYPWGRQWPWGFEWGDEGRLVIWNPLVRVGTHFVYDFIDTALAESPLHYYVPVAQPRMDPDDTTTEWGVAVDVDWASAHARSASLSVVTALASIHTHPEFNPNPADGTAYERIPIAWFRGRTLMLDFIHGIYVPQAWIS